MAKPAPPSTQDDPRETVLMQSLTGFVDTAWYKARYPDIAAADLHPLRHFIRHGIAEQRDPNPFFDGGWYTEHYPDVSSGGHHPLLHYLQNGASALRNPHPHFDAAWYATEHPEAAGNPLLYHIKIGKIRGYPTERPFDIQNYLPSQGKAPPVPKRIVVDIVIPVFGGLQETRRCLESVLENTGKPLGRVIVVDDRGPEPELSAWLRQLAGQGRVHLIRNPRNVGFVASVNTGMQAAGSHDVVLLNSDTEVPPDWLPRLTAQAYAEPRIATVSPFSNNATICGYPSNESNPLAFGLPTADLDQTCQTVNAGRAVDVPTTVGFCMYIRRKALRQIGNFDAKRFGLGYGEENDFCLRASDLGWKHRLACDTFVYHKGSVSFGDRAAKLSKKAMDLLSERYPSYQRDVARHVEDAAVVPFRFAVTASLFRWSKLPVILMVAHDLGGGVRRHITSLTQRFHDQARFVLLQATDRGVTLSVPSLPYHPTLSLPAERLNDLVLLLQSMNLSRVHIHHLLGMDMDIRALIRRLGVPFDLTVHDYFGICPQINLLPWRHSLYCGEPDIAGCNACIANRSSHGARDIVTWRAEQAWQFKDAARVFCPSVDVLTRLQRFGIANKAVLAPHEAVVASAWPQRVAPPIDRVFKIAVLGTLVDHKGGRTVARFAELLNPKTTELHVIGHVEGDFPEQALKRMKVTGLYEEHDLVRLIEATAPHAIWFPAPWPETFSFTLSTAIEAGIPIVATNIGAYPERLANRPFTWMAEIGTSPQAWIEIFAEVRENLESTGSQNRSTPIRAEIKDYYQSNYLCPNPQPRSIARRTRARPRIAVIPERFEAGFLTPCAYIRLLQPLHHPMIAGGVDVQVVSPETVFDCDAEIIITQRFALPGIQSVDRLAAHARSVGATLLFDLDDDLLNVPRNHPDARLLRPHAKVARRMLDVADAVWLSTAALAERLSSIRPDAEVVENGLDERIWRAPIEPSDDQSVRILCMGTTTHESDFALIQSALSRVKAEYGDRVVIDIVGMTTCNDLPEGLNRIRPPANAWRSYPGFVNWLTAVDPPWHIGLAPLIDTPFNLCKSPIKAMDYAALGLAILASDTPVYRRSIADGPAGQLVANNPAAWYGALTWLLRNRDLRRTIAGRSRNVFIAQSSLTSQAKARHDTIKRLLAARRADVAA